MQLQPINIIELRGVSKNFDDKEVLCNVNLNVRKGDFVAITGPNGGGKTTLLRIILQLIKPTTGEVIYRNSQGEEVKNITMGYLPQKNLIDVNFPITVEEVVQSGMLGKKGLFHSYTKADKKRVEEVMEQMGVLHLRSNAIGSLSGGQLQRTLLGRAIIVDPEVLILDEPLSYVDKDFESKMYEIIGEIAKTKTILLVSHEMTMIAKMANRHVIVDCNVHDCHASQHYVKSECK